MTFFIPFFISSLIVFSSPSLAGGEYIVRWKPGVSPEKLAANYAMKVTSVVPQLNIGLLKSVSNSPVLEKQQWTTLRKDSRVIWMQEDHPVSLRRLPDDPSYNRQWSLMEAEGVVGISAPAAWSTFGTGGKDALGNKIAVGVVDAGFYTDQVDLKENIYQNSLETPGNGIDDDENGYVDDVKGWNAYSDNGAHRTGSHGTHVAGIIGAVGDNGEQVAGINWNSQLVLVSGASGTTSVVLRAYGYLLAQKKLWIETEGKKGANVVAVNSSFGIDRAKCNSGNYPAWNDIYNEMGQAGILSMVATSNWNVDVDRVGDVPSGCDSQYIIAVTNSTKTGSKYSRAGYGQKAIDLAAPGEAIYSTYTRNRASSLSGTSMATPHVTGAVGYLYSVASKEFLEQAKKTPGESALKIRDAILSTVRPIEDLKTKTVTGGVLDLFKAAQKVSTMN